MGNVEINLADPKSVVFDDTGRSPAFFCQADSMTINQKLLEDLKENSHRLGDRDVRICLHKTPQDPFHEMVNLQHRNKYHPPHKHPSNGESYHVLEGALAVFIFDDAGVVTESILLKPEGNFLYRVPPIAFHFMMPVSDIAIYKESKPGPFRPNQDILSAPWAPDISDREKLQAYGDKLMESLNLV